MLDFLLGLVIGATIVGFVAMVYAGKARGAVAQAETWAKRAAAAESNLVNKIGKAARG